MYPHKLMLVVLLVLFTSVNAFTQKRKVPPGGRLGVIVDERLAALRATPQLDGRLVRRLGRGRVVAIRASKKTDSGLVFLPVNISTRTHGWIQREAVAATSSRPDEDRLLLLIRNSSEFDRVSRSRIFLDYFPRSSRRAEVLLLLGDTAEAMAVRLSRDAARRVDHSGTASEGSYFLNYSGLDRYNRLGVLFIFDAKLKQLHYNGAAWREIMLRFPRDPEAVQARARLDRLRSLLFSVSLR